MLILDNKKELDDLIEEALSYPDLEIRDAVLGKVYDPENESATDGYIEISNITDYIMFEKWMVEPRLGVGHKIKDKDEILRYVEFLNYDEEEMYGKELSEFGFKFSKAIPNREPLGIVTVRHEFGVKQRGNDYRWTKSENAQKTDYIFMFIEDANDPEGGYYKRIFKKKIKKDDDNQDKQKVLTEAEKNFLLYEDRAKRSAELKVMLNGFFKKYRLETLKNYYKETSPGTYDFNLEIDIDIDGKTNFRGVLEFIKNTQKFIDETIRFVKGRLIIRDITLVEYDHIIEELNEAMAFSNVAMMTVEYFSKQLGEDASFISIAHDWYLDYDQNEREKVLSEVLNKKDGPVEKLREKMRRLLDPRLETLKEIKGSKNHKRGFIFIDTKNKNLIPNVGEMIRRNYLYENVGKDEMEQEIKSYILKEEEIKKSKKDSE